MVHVAFVYVVYEYDIVVHFFIPFNYLSGLKPFDLYGKYTWKIEKFSTINKRELKSSVFEVGGYKW